MKKKKPFYAERLVPTCSKLCRGSVVEGSRTLPDRAATSGSGLFARIYRLVGSVPKGKVTTYGTIAKALGNPRLSRRVGFALASLPEGSPIPWHRVVGKNGISLPNPYGALQKSLLAKEKVRFDEDGKPLAKYRYEF